MTPGDRDQLVWMQNSEPSGLYCGDESDGDALRICQQIFDSLYQYKVGRSRDRSPRSRQSCDPSTDLKTWTCKLREASSSPCRRRSMPTTSSTPTRPSGTPKNPLHVGNAGTFDYFPALFGGFLNPPPPAP